MFDDHIDRIFGRSTDTNDFQDTAQQYDTHKWALGDHGKKPTISETDLLDAAKMVDGVDNDLKSVFEEAASRVGNIGLHDFECPVCGQTHGHDDAKHDIRASPPDGFNVTNEFADRMEFDPKCHCGVNELAALIDTLIDEHTDLIPQVFSDAGTLSERDLEERASAIKSAADGADVIQAVESYLEEFRQELEADQSTGDFDFQDPTDDDGTMGRF